jgi:GMP synthase-like glutamine amidotransferase
MHLCILENDDLDPTLAQRYTRVAAMFERLFAQAGYQGRIDTFSARHGQYPASFAAYDAVLLTGSRADAFSDEPWVVALREQVARLLQDQHKLLGVCFGHQLIAHCLGASVQRAPRGWRVGRQAYDWLGAPEHLGLAPGQSAQAAQVAQVALLASHQDQVLALPPGPLCWPHNPIVRWPLTRWGTRCFAFSHTRSSRPRCRPFCWTSAAP